MGRMTEALSHRQTCSSCGHPNELPFIFCAACGAPRVHLGRWRVTILRSLVMTAFLAPHYFAEIILWGWPYYLLYALLFTLFMASLVKGDWRLGLRLWGWFSVFLGGAFAYFLFVHPDIADLIAVALESAVDLARDEPLLFYPAALAIVIPITVPAYLRWGRLYGWVNAYRVMILSALAVGIVALIACHTVRFAAAHEVLPAQRHVLNRFVDQTLPEYQGYAAFFTITTLRLFLLEIFIFAAVRGYALARHAAASAPPLTLADESAFARSLFQIARILRSAALAIENMVRYTVTTVVLLARDIAQVVVAFTREVLVPSIALALSGALLFVMANATSAYIETVHLGQVALLLLSLLALLCLGLVHLACKTPHRWGRIISFYAQLTGWLMPNLLVFFLLMSLSLWAYGSALRSLEVSDLDMPYRLGPLTIAVAVLLAALVTAVFIRKRSVLFAPAEATTETAPAPPPAAPAPPPEPAAPEDEKQEGGLLHRAHSFLQALIPWHGAGRVSEWGRGIGERLRTDDPREVRELIKLTAQREQMREQLRALEQSSGDIADETYESLHQQRTGELKVIERKCKRIRAQVAQVHAESLVERKSAEETMAELTARREEMDRLRESGTLSAADHRTRVAPLKIEIESTQLRLAVLERRTARLAPLIRDEPEL